VFLDATAARKNFQENVAKWIQREYQTTIFMSATTVTQKGLHKKQA